MKVLGREYSESHEHRPTEFTLPLIFFLLQEKLKELLNKISEIFLLEKTLRTKKKGRGGYKDSLFLLAQPYNYLRIPSNQ